MFRAINGDTNTGLVELFIGLEKHIRYFQAREIRDSTDGSSDSPRRGDTPGMLNKEKRNEKGRCTFGD